MDKIAIRQAWQALEKARHAHHLLANSITTYQVESAWSDFLTAAGRVYTKLQKGSIGNSKSETWFGRIKHSRKTDELLKYIHHARNTAEHGIQELMQGQPGFSGVQIVGDRGTLESITIDVQGNTSRVVDVKVKSDSGKARAVPVDIKATLRLITVHDTQHGDSFDPPANHLGDPLNEASPLEVASLALQYLERIVREGSELSK